MWEACCSLGADDKSSGKQGAGDFQDVGPLHVAVPSFFVASSQHASNESEYVKMSQLTDPAISLVTRLSHSHTSQPVTVSIGSQTHDHPL
jgi:hypothetical protein